MRVIIVDDEPLAQDVLETYIQNMPDLELVKKCSNALEADEVLKSESIDLMLLDIQMPQLTGIDFLKTLSNPPIVIFTTAYPNYALEGFELNALDYLLKPISLDRFMKALNKAREIYELKNKEALKEVNTIEMKKDHFFVKSDKKLIKVQYKDIIYVEGLKDYVIIRMNDSRVITLQTMKSMAEKFPSDQFLRIHRSYIVNITKIQAIMGNMVEVKEKGEIKHLPVGKNYRDQLHAIINKHKL